MWLSAFRAADKIDTKYNEMLMNKNASSLISQGCDVYCASLRRDATDDSSQTLQFALFLWKVVLI